MCVIIHALKKKHLPVEEVEQAMKSNSSGFFMAALHDNGTRDTIRTLKEKELIEFFSKASEDDEIVMHARIPSAGGVSLDNVHGWEEDGIIFCHNMTITSLKDSMERDKWGDKTDSEYFFRKIFIPLYRAFGKNAYVDGKFCEYIDRIVEFFVGYNNKFCFIMPDNTVIRYGKWIAEPSRKEGDEIAFHASNGSYTVQKGVMTGYSSVGFRYSTDDIDTDYYGYDCGNSFGNQNYFENKYKPIVKPTTEEKSQKKPDILDVVGMEEVLEFGLSYMVVMNILQTVYVDADVSDYLDDTLRDELQSLSFHSDDLIDKTISASIEEKLEQFSAQINGVIETSLATVDKKYLKTNSEDDYYTVWTQMVSDVITLKKLLNIELDFSKTNIDDIIVHYRIEKDKDTGRMKIVVTPAKEILDISLGTEENFLNLVNYLNNLKKETGGII